MNTWMVGYHPAGHFVYNLRSPQAKADHAAGKGLRGNKTYFMKARIMAGQADLSANLHDLKDFKWLSKEEIKQYVSPQYFSSIKDMLGDR